MVDSSSHSAEICSEPASDLLDRKSQQPHPRSRTARNRRTSCGAYANASGDSNNKFNRW